MGSFLENDCSPHFDPKAFLLGGKLSLPVPKLALSALCLQPDDLSLPRWGQRELPVCTSGMGGRSFEAIKGETLSRRWSGNCGGSLRGARGSSEPNLRELLWGPAATLR